MARTNRLGVVAYGSFGFPIAYQSRVDVRPVYDSSGRTVKYSEWTVRIEFTTTSDDLIDIPGNPSSALSGNVPVDAGMQNLFSILTQPGLQFQFSGQGIGGNQPDGTFIANFANCIGYGPSPQIVSWRSLGANQAIGIVWEVKFNLTACTGTKGPIGEHVYTVAWSNPYTGYSKRTVSGKVQFNPGRTSDGSNQVIDVSVDSFFDAIVATFNYPNGFTRTAEHQLSEDRAWLSYTIVDEEIQSDQPYPPSIQRPHCTQSVSSALSDKLGLVRWIVTFDGSFQLVQNAPRSAAYTAFIAIVRDRIGVSGGFQLSSLLNIRFNLIEDIWEGTVGFSVSYMIGGNTSSTMVTPANVIVQAGLYRPVPFDWATWTISVQSVQNGRGIMRMGLSDGSLPTNSLTTFCDGSSVSPGITAPTKSTLPTAQATYTQTAGGYKSDDSWGGYYNSLYIQRKGGTVVTSKLGQGVTNTPYASLIQSDQTGTSAAITGGGSSATAKPPDTPPSNVPATANVQYRNPGVAILVMEGYAIRFGQPVAPIPFVSTIGGQPAVPTGEEEIRPSGPIFWTVENIPAYACSWRRKYYLNNQGNGQIVVAGVPSPYTQDPAQSNSSGFPVISQ